MGEVWSLSGMVKTTNANEPLTKLEVARRQLVTATRLFFEDEDSVSIYTLSHAAWEVVDSLCKHNNKIRFFDQMVRANKMSEKELRKIAAFGKNFFKHADRDPDGVLTDFSDELNDHVMIAAGCDYGMLVNAQPIELQVFKLWYFAVYPEKIPLPVGDAMLNAVQNIFPKINELDRAAQKAEGLKFLTLACEDPLIMEDVTTDKSNTGSLFTKC